jgi:HEAT repeat protein
MVTLEEPVESQDRLRDAKAHHHIRAARAHLDSSRAAVRDEAVQELIAIGAPAVKPMIIALQSPSSFVRAGAARALQGIGEPAVEALAVELQHTDAKTREAAAAALAGFQSERAVMALRDWLSQEIAASRRRRYWWSFKRALFILGLLYLCFSQVSSHSDWFFQPFFMVLIIMGGFVDSSAYLRRSTVRALGATTDARLIGALAACLSDTDRTVRNAATAALKKLLPQVKAGDKQHIAPAEMDALIRELNGSDAPLTIAILRAFEQIGDERALPEVEWLAMGNADLDSDVPAEVRRAAQECLPFLRLRAEQAEQARTLLRASTPTDAAAPDMLLRPAPARADETPPEQLLRAQSGPESG